MRTRAGEKKRALGNAIFRNILAFGEKINPVSFSPFPSSPFLPFVIFSTPLLGSGRCASLSPPRSPLDLVTVLVCKWLFLSLPGDFVTGLACSA